MKTVTIYEGKAFNAFPDAIAGEKGSVYTFVVRDEDDSLYDLTGATVTFKLKQINTSANKASVACVLSAPTSGECTYTVGLTDFDTVGVFDAQLLIVNGSLTSAIFLGRFQIQKALP